ncbi:hypothetical protein SGPA1_21211 [Streptomyces misionensis JCM 4497]
MPVSSPRPDGVPVPHDRRGGRGRVAAAHPAGQGPRGRRGTALGGPRPGPDGRRSGRRAGCGGEGTGVRGGAAGAGRDRPAGRSPADDGGRERAHLGSGCVNRPRVVYRSSISDAERLTEPPPHPELPWLASPVQPGLFSARAPTAGKKTASFEVPWAAPAAEMGVTNAPRPVQSPAAPEPPPARSPRHDQSDKTADRPAPGAA